MFFCLSRAWAGPAAKQDSTKRKRNKGEKKVFRRSFNCLSVLLTSVFSACPVWERDVVFLTGFDALGETDVLGKHMFFCIRDAGTAQGL